MKNGPSPDWLQARLDGDRPRPISALVDITNYITFTYARPLHVFDADKIKGGIHARLARAANILRPRRQDLSARPVDDGHRR